MPSEIEFQRQTFEADYPSDRGLWLAKHEDGRYKNLDLQDAWSLFLKGWNACLKFNSTETKAI